MKTKVLLLQPSLTSTQGAAADTQVTPLGLAYLAAVSEKTGFETKIIDSLIEGIHNKEWLDEKTFRVGLTENQLKERLLKFKPNVIGISAAYTVYIQDSYKAAELIKKILPNSIIVFGGAHSSANPESVLKECTFVDLVCVGEGELTFLEIIEKTENKKKLTEIKGTVERQENKIIRNEAREHIKDLDTLPFPARHLIPLKDYIANEKNHYPFARKNPVGEIITSRGCPGDCVFCSIKTIWGRTWRYRSALNVVDEMELAHKKFDINEFNVLDDNVSVNKQRLMDICNEIIKRKLNISWETSNGIAIWTLDEEVLRKMKESGYYRIKFGIESGSLNTLKYIRKPVNHQRAKEIIKICNKIGLWSASTFVIGFPDETKNDIEQTIEFAKNSGLDFARFLIAQPYAGTELYKDFEKKGLLKNGIQSASSTFTTKYNSTQLSAGELNALRQRAEKEFMQEKMKRVKTISGFKNEVLTKLKSPSDLIYFTKILKIMTNKKLKGSAI